MNRRGPYRHRLSETKKRVIERRKESHEWHESESKQWVSLKSKQLAPSFNRRLRYVAVEEVTESDKELARAVLGESQRVDKYQAARIIVAQAIEKGLITAND